MKTIIAAFCDDVAAQQGAKFLRSELTAKTATAGTQIHVLGYASANNDALGMLRRYNVPEDRRQIYAEVLRRGATLLVAQVPDGDARGLARDLDRMGSLDLDASVARWRKSGWNGYDANALPFDANACATERTALAREGTYVDGEPRELDVVEERVHVGTREVDRGGVRARTVVVERPFETDVELHEERVIVDREQLDEPLTSAGADAAFTEEDIVVTARGEEAVVGKEARVVERVHVGKVDETRTEHIRETERRKDVEVEQLPGRDRTVNRASDEEGTLRNRR